MKTLKEKWKKRIDAWKASGMSIRAWCRQHNISHSTFGYWKRGKLSQSSSKEKNSKFIELQDKRTEETGLSLSTKGLKVHLSKNFDSETLHRFLNVLRNL